MPSFRFGLAFALVSFVAAAAPLVVTAADAPADGLCPRAVPKLVAFNDAAAAKDAAKILSATRAAADAYLTCLAEARTRTYEEPTMNYDRTRAAQFLVVEGRALAAAGDTKAANAALHDARALAEFVVTWLPAAQTYRQSSGAAGNNAERNTDRNGSRYQDAANEIRAAADAELAKLATTPAPQASPKP